MQWSSHHLIISEILKQMSCKLRTQLLDVNRLINFMIHDMDMIHVT